MSKKPKKPVPFSADHEITELFLKAIRKSNRILRNTEFNSYYEQNQAQELAASLEAAVTVTLRGGVYDEEVSGMDSQGVTVHNHVLPGFFADEAGDTWDLINVTVREADTPQEYPTGEDARVINIFEGISARATALELARQREEGNASVFDLSRALRESKKEYDPKGWPLNTPVSEMTEGEQILWWKHQARKSEARSKKYFKEVNELRADLEKIARRQQEPSFVLNVPSWFQAPALPGNTELWRQL